MKGVRMKVYGITGGAGTGKSEVMRMLRDDFNGYIILSDDVARELSLKGGISYGLIVDHFGEEILGADGEIDRKKLAQVVFNDKEALEKLNGMTHPYVKEEIRRRLAEAEDSGKYAFGAVESALLPDCGYDDICQEYWYVHSSPEIRRRRMKESRGYSDEKVDSIMHSQLSEAVFLERCQFVIENNTNLAAVYEQLKSKLGE